MIAPPLLIYKSAEDNGRVPCKSTLLLISMGKDCKAIIAIKQIQVNAVRKRPGLLVWAVSYIYRLAVDASKVEPGA